MYQYFLSLLLVASAVIPATAQTLDAPAPAYVEPVMAGTQTRILESPGRLTLGNAITLAISANAELSAAQREFEAVQATVLQASMLPNPSVGMEVLDTHRETRETTLLLSQPIELGGKRSARMQAAERGQYAALAELNTKRTEVRATVISAFFDVLTAQERVRLVQDSVELTQRATAVAVQRVAAGKVSPIEETKARIAESSVRLELVQAKGELAIARKRLSATWGNLAPRFERAEGQLDALPELPQPDLLGKRLATAPALVRARLEIERRRALSQLERSRRIQDLTVSMGLKRNEELGRNQTIIGVSIPIPIFDNNRGNILESLRRENKARDELAGTEVRLGSELAHALERLSTSRQEVDTLQKEILPGAESAYDAATKGFEFGKFGFLEVLDAQRTLLQAKSQYLRAQSEAHRSAAEIDRILGEPPQSNMQ